MREDQFQRLQSLTEKLTDVVLDEADPSSWPGDGMTTETWRALEIADAKEAQRIRGDRYWSKKNAAATLTLVTKVYTLLGITTKQNPLDQPPGGEDDADLDKEYNKAERAAEKILASHQARAYGRAT